MFSRLRLPLAAIAALALNLAVPSTARATELDCTVSCNLVPFAGALWSTSAAQSTGTGVIDSFVRIQGAAHSAVDGHNTDGTRVNNELGGTWTHSITLGDVPIIKINNKLYYEFFLDINQEKSDPLLALNNVQICTSSTSGSLSQADACPTGPLYTMGAFGAPGPNPDYVKMDYKLNAGSGSGDLFMYIPVSTLGTNMTDYLYLFSQFGAVSGLENNDGFEEWAVRICGEVYGKSGKGKSANPGSVLNCEPPPPSVPEPGSLILLGTGLAGIVAIARRRRIV